MRVIVEALVESLPGMGSVLALLGLVMYVFAVIATRFYGPSFPEWFGSIDASLFSLFQVMTLESWSTGIVRPIMKIYPYSWIFFVLFILFSAFAFLNLVIAVMVRAMQSTIVHEKIEDAEQTHVDQVALAGEIRDLRREIGELKAALAGPDDARHPGKSPP